MKRKKLLQFAAFLAFGAFAMASCDKHDSDESPILSEADLPGHTLTTLAGSYYDNKYAQTEGITPFLVNSEADAIQAVRTRKADVLVTDEIVLPEDLLKSMGLKRAFTGEESFPCAMAFQKGDDILLPAFDEFLDIMKEDGSLEAHINYWLHGGEPAKYPESGKEGKSSKPIRLITCLKTAPISFIKDNEWTGLEIELIRKFAAWNGSPLSISDLPLTSAIIALQTGQADIIASNLFVTEDRKKHMDFSQPYYVGHPAFFVLDENATSTGSSIGKLKDTFIQTFVTEKRWKLITDGLLVTLAITLLSILLGTILGVVYCQMALSRSKLLRDITKVYNFIIQGIPTLVLLLIMFYVVLAKTGLSAAAVSVITFALGFAASSGNVLTSSISSIPKGQWEAGYALGFTHGRTFLSIILPQALRKGIGAYEGHCIALMKGTSIVGYIAVQDLTRASDLLRSRTFEAFLPLIAITIIYFVIAWLFRLLLNLAITKKNYD